MKQPIPVVDIFAGPGGLGEGFSSIRSDKAGSIFKVVLSIEKEEFSYQTLKLRAFFREFTPASAPEEYYQFLKGKISKEEMFQKYAVESRAADQIAWLTELGVENPDTVDRRIIKSIGKKTRWVLIGGPPCQAYSIAGRSRKSKIWRDNPSEKENDKRHFLYREYLRILSVHKPPVFVMENVKGMLSSDISEGNIIDLIFRDLRNLGYRLYPCVSETPARRDIFGEQLHKPKEFIVRSEEHGIPQKRHRVIILGISGELNVTPETMVKKPYTVKLADCIGDLPRLRSGLSKTSDSIHNWLQALKYISNTGIFEDQKIDKRIKTMIQQMVFQVDNELGRGGEYVSFYNAALPNFEQDWFFDKKLEGICNHSSRGHIKEDLFRYLFATCFAKVNEKTPKLSDFPEYLLPKHANVEDGVLNGKFSDRFRVQLAEFPSTTVTSHISKDGHYFIHPDPFQCRSLTVREAARLQTFPDNYYFLGPRTAQYVQVGNAVPPLLAKQIAQIVSNVLWQIE